MDTIVPVELHAGTVMDAGSLQGELDGPRPAGPYDLAPLLDLINLVFRTGAHPAAGDARPPSMGWDYTHVYHSGNLENVRVITHHGRVVCSIGIHNTTVHTPRGPIDVGGINAVGTHPDYRRHGLATATLIDCHRRMRATGRHIGLLSTGIHNWYRKLGWERAGRQYTFTLDRRSIQYLPSPDDLDITEDWRSHIAALCDLRQAAPLGAVRDLTTFRLLAERKARRIFVARRRGEVVAYVALSGSSVRDYGGAADDVAGALRAALQAVDRADARTTDRSGTGGHVELNVLAPVAGDPLPDYLLSRGIPYGLGYLGMIKLLDPPALLDTLRIRDVTVEPLGGDQAAGDPSMERWRVRHGGVAVELSEGELVKLFFGPERRPDFSPDCFPLIFWQSPFDRV